MTTRHLPQLIPQSTQHPQTPLSSHIIIISFLSSISPLRQHTLSNPTTYLQHSMHYSYYHTVIIHNSKNSTIYKNKYQSAQPSSTSVFKWHYQDILPSEFIRWAIFPAKLVAFRRTSAEIRLMIILNTSVNHQPKDFIYMNGTTKRW